MDYPQLVDPGYDPAILAQAKRIADSYRKGAPAPVQPQQPVAVQAPNGILTDIGHGFARGTMVEAPRIVGQALQAFGAEETGKSLVDFARERENEPLYQTTGAWGAGASMVPTALGVGATVFIPGVGEIAAPALGAALFGGSQYTEARERGVSVPGALGEAAIQGVGQAALAYGAGRILGGISRPLMKTGAQEVMDGFASPSTIGRVAKNVATQAAVQVPVQAAAQAGIAAIEEGEGKEGPTSWEAAKASVQPTLAMTALLAPFGLGGTLLDNARRRVIAENVVKPPEPGTSSDGQQAIARTRMLMAATIAKEMRRVDPTAADAWQNAANMAISAGKPVELHADWRYEPTPEAPEAPAAPLQLEYRPQVGETAGPIATSLDLERQRVAEENAAMQAARDAEEGRRSEAMANVGIPEQPSRAIDVTEIPTQEVQPPAFPVRQFGPVEHIEGAPAPEETIPAKGGRGAGLSAEEAATRIAAVKAQEEALPKPAQGTAEALGLPLGLVKSVDERAGVKPAVEARVKALRDTLGKGTPSNVLRELASASDRDLPEAIRAMWHDKGGENSKSAYVVKLEDLYTRLTGGRDIRGEQRENTNAAKADERTGATAVSGEAAKRTEQVAKGEGNAKAEPIQNVGDINALSARQEPSGGKSEHQNGDIGRQTAQSGGGDSAAQRGSAEEKVGGTPRRTEAQVKQQRAAGLTPVVRFGGQLYEGRVHGEAIRAAMADPNVPKTDRGFPIMNAAKGDAIDLFRTPEGEVLTRAQAEEYAGQKIKSEDLPRGQQLKQERAAAPATPSAAATKRTEAEAKARIVQKQKEDAAAQRVAEVERTLATHDRQTIALQNEHDQLSEKNSEQAARKREIEQELAARLQERNKLQGLHGDAIADEERVLNKREFGGIKPETTVAYRPYARVEWDRNKSTNAQQNLLHSFVHDRVLLGRATPAEREAWKYLHPKGTEGTGESMPRGVPTKKAAEAALDRLSEAGTQRYVERAAQFARANKLALDMGKKTKKIEAANKQREQRDILKYQLAQAKDLKAQGRLTEEQYLARVTEIARAAHKVESSLDELGRGIVEYSDPELHARVQAEPTAQAAMDHIARNHNDPFVRAIAKLLGGHSQLNASVSVQEIPSFDGGRYYPSSDAIVLGRGGANPATMMHETTHSLVHKKLGSALADQFVSDTELNAQQRKNVAALKTVQDAMEAFRAKADMSDPSHVLALRSEQEFVAEALNNPSIQNALGARGGWMAKLANAFRTVLGIDPKFHGQFADLLHAATDLFGDARHDTLESYQKAVLGTDRDGEQLYFARSPRDFFAAFQRGSTQLSTAGDTLYHNFRDKDIPARVRKEVLSWLSNAHNTSMLERAITRIQRANVGNPERVQKLQAFADTARRWKASMEMATSMSGYLINGKHESNEIINRGWLLRSRDRPAIDTMGEMATNGRLTGVYPGAKTFEEARAFNPGVTEQMWNHPAAQRARMQYRQLAKQKPEAVALYEDMLWKNRTDYARHAALNVANLLHGFGQDSLTDIKALDWARYARQEVEPKEQWQKLDTAMRDAQRAVDAAHEKAGLQQETAEGKKALSDATQLKAGIDELVRIYDNQRNVPYVHVGRSGQYHMGFRVTDAPGAWEAVGKIMSTTRAQGGLERDWREMLPMRGKNEFNRDVYMRFGSQQELNEAEQKLKGVEHLFEPDSYFRGASLERSRSLDAASPKFLSILERKIKDSGYDDQTTQDLINNIRDAYYQQAPETSPLKAKMFADGTAGASKDFMQSYADRMTMANTALVNAWRTPRVAEAVQNMESALKTLEKEGLGDDYGTLAAYTQQAKTRAEQMRTAVSAPLVDKIKAINAAWQFALSPAYTAMVMYQPWQVTMPKLGSQFGYANSLRAMAGNFKFSMALMKELFKLGWANTKGESTGFRLSSLSDLQLRFNDIQDATGGRLFSGPQGQERLQFMNDLQWSQLLNFGQAQSIFRTSPFDRSKLANATRVATLMAHYAELVNRTTGALTSFDLARKSGKSYEQARDFALQTVRETDGDHSQSNVALRLGRRGFAGKITPLFVGWQQYDYQMTELLARNIADTFGRGRTNTERVQALKFLGGVGATTAAMAGVLGMPFLGTGAAVYNAVTSLLQDETDTPPDIMHSAREALNGIFGEEGGGVVAKGLPRIFDIDMSTRSGYQDLAPFSEFLQDRRMWDDRLKDAALQFVGPAVGAAANLVKAGEAAYMGDWLTAINNGLPAELRNIAKAGYIANYGYQTQGGNNTIPMPVTSWNVLAQSMGFLSAGKSDQSQRAFEFGQNQQIIERRQQRIHTAIYRAYERGDWNALGDLMQRNIDFVLQHPMFKGDVAGGLRERAVERAVGAISGTGVLAGKRKLPMIENYFPQWSQ